MAFDFPPAQDGLRVTNPESGVTYVYRAKYQSWIIEGVDNKAVRVHTLCCKPCDANQGDLWYNPCTYCLSVYNEGDWLPVVDCMNAAGCVAYKGEKQFFHELPGKGNERGDLWAVLEEPALYLWSTNGWIPADRYDDTELRQLIQEEEDARKEADREIRQDLREERKERKEEDEKLWDALKEEEVDRIEGDRVLWELIDNCCTNASDGLEALNDALDKEREERIEGDKNLSLEIDKLEAEQEKTNDRLDQEILDRIEGDKVLTEGLEQEIIDREAGDKALWELVDAKSSKWQGEVPTADDLPTTRYLWQPLTAFQCETLYSITWGPQTYIAGTSNGHAWSSEDGVFWQRRNVGVAFNGKVTATFYANGVWLLGGDSGLVSRSSDGKAWSNIYSTTTSNAQDFAYGNGTYVYVTDGGVVATSPDGVSWTKQDHTIAWGAHGIDSILSVTYSETLARFVACTQRGAILISDTGMGWDLVNPGLNGSGKLLTIASVEFDGTPILVAGGDFAERLIYSEDSLNWVAAPRNYFGDGFPTELVDCGTHVITSLSNGNVAFAYDQRVQSWTVEPTGSSERLLSIAHGPQCEFITYPEGNYVTGGGFGQAFVRLPGDGLEPGDTWVVLDEMCLYTWSSNGWVTSCGNGGDGSGGNGGNGGGGNGIELTRITSVDGSVTITPATGAGPVVDLSVESSSGAVDTRGVDLIPPGKRTSELFPLTEEETQALSDLMPALGMMHTQEDYNAWILKALGILATCPCSKEFTLDGTDAEWDSHDTSIMSLDGGDALLALPENISPNV